ncbi:MAG: hypothetical protein LCH38_11015 [Proteobacteria bacterium]|nr:hypothetical protein [Pseudomonadota bacterium]
MSKRRVVEGLDPVFVNREALCTLLMIGQTTLADWLRRKVIPDPHIRDGGIERWHWPSVEAALARPAVPVESAAEVDPSVAGALRVGKKSAHRAVA